MGMFSIPKKLLWDILVLKPLLLPALWYALYFECCMDKKMHSCLQDISSGCIRLCVPYSQKWHLRVMKLLSVYRIT